MGIDWSILMDKLTCITATHNRSYLLPRVIQSIVNQTRQPDRWIIIDDSSADNTPEIIKTVPEDLQKRILYRRFDTRVGVAKAKNRGIELAGGDTYIHIHDDDDVILPNFYERMLQEIQDVDIAFCNFHVIKEVIQPDGNLLDISTEIIQDWQGFIPGKQKEHPYISMVTSLIRPGFFYEYGMFPEDLNFCLEWVVFLEAELRGAKFKFVDEILGEIRWRWGNDFCDNIGFSKNPLEIPELQTRIKDLVAKYEEKEKEK